jgi:hypothetical protein
MDPRCKVLLVMGKNDANNPDPYRQQSVVIVPLPYPGVKVLRHTTVMGYDVCRLLDVIDGRMPHTVTQRSNSRMFAFRSRIWCLVKDGGLRSSKDVSVQDAFTIGTNSSLSF